MKQYDIRLAKVPQPPKDCTGEPVMLTDATIQERLDKVLQGMKNRGLEQLVVYRALRQFPVPDGLFYPF
mgnify:FL=1